MGSAQAAFMSAPHLSEKQLSHPSHLTWSRGSFRRNLDTEFSLHIVDLWLHAFDGLFELVARSAILMSVSGLNYNDIASFLIGLNHD